MLISNPLTEKTFLNFAMKIYDNPNCTSADEFEEDLNRVKYVKRLLNRYVEKNSLKTRLLLNHIIILSNVFGTTGTTRLLFFKLEENLFPSLKTTLTFLKFLPNTIPEINLKSVPVDPKLLKILGEIK